MGINFIDNEKEGNYISYKSLQFGDCFTCSPNTKYMKTKECAVNLATGNTIIFAPEYMVLPIQIDATVRKI
jgi:hypothetical protein